MFLPDTSKTQPGFSTPPRPLCCLLLFCHHFQTFLTFIRFVNIRCQRRVSSMPSVHVYIYGFYWRQNSVAVHDPWTRTFHGVTPPRPPTRQLPRPPMPVWIWRNVPWRKPKLWFLQPNMPVTMRWWWWWWWCFLFCFFFFNLRGLWVFSWLFLQ